MCYIVTALAVHLPHRAKALALPVLTACWRPNRTKRPTGKAGRNGPLPHADTAHVSTTAATARILDTARTRHTQAHNGLQLRLDKEAALPAGHRLPGTDPKPALKTRLNKRAQELEQAQADHDQALTRVLELSTPTPGPPPPPPAPAPPTQPTSSATAPSTWWPTPPTTARPYAPCPPT